MKTEPSTALDSHDGRESDSADAGSRPVPPEQVVAWISGVQRPLYAYIRTLVGPGAEVEDILQAVNLVLCRKAAEFDGRGQFLTWACRVAYFQVLAFLKERRRDRHAYFDEAV